MNCVVKLSNCRDVVMFLGVSRPGVLGNVYNILIMWRHVFAIYEIMCNCLKSTCSVSCVLVDCASVLIGLAGGM